jgi:hypothetical protein
MRRLVSVLFIALLLLRSLMGSAMAAAPVPNLPTAAMQQMVQSAHEHGVQDFQSDSAANACPDTAGSGCADHAAHTGHPDCTVCAGCHAAMPAQPTLLAHSVRPPSDKTARTATRFASAPAALAIKPPIV